MTAPKLVLVARRYWPLVGGRESRMARLAEALAARGVAVTVLTPRWDRSWPAETVQSAARIVRVPPPKSGLMGLLAHLRTLRVWLHQHRAEFDLAWVEGLKHDACAVISAARQRPFPVVLEPVQPGPAGDCHWQIDARCGARIKRYCQQATAYVAHSRQLERELIAAGYARGRIHYLPHGVHPREAVGALDRAAARRDLDQASEALSLPPDAQVILYLGTMEPGRGLPALVDAFYTLSSRFPQARLWLAGAARDETHLSERVARLGLAGRAVLTGTFDDAEQLLSACNVAVFPTEVDRLPVSLLEAMMAGLPVVAGDVASVREYVTDGIEGLLVPPGRADVLAARLAAVLEDADLRGRLGAAARQRALDTAAFDTLADRAAELVARLVADWHASG